MATLTAKPTTATLRRFSINLDKLSKEFEIWTLEFPFGEAVGRYRKKVEDRIKDKVKGEYIGIPYRQLNNALMAVCPTLTHGFEYAGKSKPYRALAVGVPSAPAQLPEPESIRYIVRAWAQWWTERSYIVKNIPEDERKTMRAELLASINATLSDWVWKLTPAHQLLRSFNPNDPLNYSALPSLLAALLHNQESILHGKRVQWRKVQDSDNKLSIIGFIDQRPIWTRYSIREFQMNKSGEGFFAYKVEFRLETQAGRTAPWMFVSLHAQRYGHKSLTKDNESRRVSVLTGANRARLDDFPIDSTLVKLQVKNGSEGPEWDDNLVEILERIGATGLELPTDIFADPLSYWANPNKDEHYIIHATGYGYGETKKGHELEAGFSMADSTTVINAIVSEHLTLLEPDIPLELDKPTFSSQKTPRAMRDYSFMAKPNRLQPDGMEKMIRQALRGQEMLIAILWYEEDTRDGICTALREAFLLKPYESFPANVTIIDRRIKPAMLEGLDKKNFDSTRRQCVQTWRDFLQTQIPQHPHRFAMIEMLKSSWQVKGAVRTACIQEGIVSQMVRPVRLNRASSDNLNYRTQDDKHRSRSVAREMILRHIGGLYGNPQEVYQAAGIKEEDLEVIAFYLKRTQTNLMYPLAIKLAFDGSVEVRLPHRPDWLLYSDAASILGQVFASEWHNTTYSGGKRKIKDEKKNKSALWHDKAKLSNFILNVLKDLQHPTIVLIEADNWRNDGTWPQLRNPDLPKNWEVLNFPPPNDKLYKREDARFNNLLAVIRMRTERETPQYFTDTLREFTQLTGLIDIVTGDLMHYFSIGRQLITAKGQRYATTRHATKLDGTGAGVAYKYPQVVEFIPFFVRDDYKTPEGLIRLCRIPHYLRISPAWPQGNIVSPYPMHLARQLVEDQLCVLAMED